MSGHSGHCLCRTVQVVGAEAIGSYRSSPAASRFWCTRCVSGLWTLTDGSDTGRGDYEADFGPLDAPGNIALSGDILIDRKPGGYALASTHERLTEAETSARFGLSTEGE